MMDIIFDSENLVIVAKSETYKQSAIEGFFSKDWKKIPLLWLRTFFSIFLHPEIMHRNLFV